MASCEQVKRVVKEETRYQLDLSEREALILTELIKFHVGGTLGQGTPREALDSIRCALQAAGVQVGPTSATAFRASDERHQWVHIS